MLPVDGKQAVLQLVRQLQVVDERFYVGGVFQYDRGVPPVSFLLPGVPVLYDLRIALNRGEGRFQIVSDVGNLFLPHLLRLFPQAVAGPDLGI